MERKSGNHQGGPVTHASHASSREQQTGGRTRVPKKLSSQHEVSKLFSFANRWQMGLQILEPYMRKSIKEKTTFDPNQVSGDDSKLLDILLNPLTEEIAGDWTFTVLDYLRNIAQQEEENVWQTTGGSGDCHMCVYFTPYWVYLLVYTPQLGNINFRFAKPNENPGFPAGMKRVDGKLIWGYDYNVLPEDKKFHDDLIVSRVINFCEKKDMNGEMIMELFQEMRACIKKRTSQNISQVMVIAPSFIITRPDCHECLRECCKAAGFQKAIILGDTSLLAYWIFSKFIPAEQNKETTSILIVNILADSNADTSIVVLEIFVCNVNNRILDGVQLLAATAEKDISINKANLAKVYERALNQIPECTRESIQYFSVLSFGDSYTMVIDDYFRDERKLTKTEQLSSENLLEVFSQFSNNPAKLRRFLDVAAVIPIATAFEIDKNNVAIDDESFKRKQMLLSTCSKMQQQIFDGTVKVGSMTKKIILNAITQGRLAVLKGSLGDEVEEEIYELFKAFNFKDADSDPITMLKSEGISAVRNADSLTSPKNPPEPMQLTGNCVADNGKHASECSQCLGRQLILNHYKIDLNSLI